jgi:hypothetical protein
LGECLDHPQFDLRIVLRVTQQHHLAKRRAGPLDRGDDVEEMVIGGERYGDADGVGGRAHQRPRQQVRRVAKIGDGALHLRRRRRHDEATAVDDVRNGGERHPRLESHILHRCHRQKPCRQKRLRRRLLLTVSGFTIAELTGPGPSGRTSLQDGLNSMSYFNRLHATVLAALQDMAASGELPKA